ncbi:MAG: hypothetical protein LBK61_08430, partial [Spirochaetaceae bacterium]|nr:hypothetical protein [Spirochaetaceae bacterium]
MTIKRRIFISHILIICIPFVLCVFFSFGIRLVTMKIYSGGTGQVYDNEIFYEARRELLNVGSRFSENTDVPDSGALKSAAEDLQKRFLKYNIFFAVYDNGQWLMPPPRKTEPLFDAALLEEGNRIVSFDTTAVYIQSIGDAKIVAVCYDFHFNDDMHITSVMVAAILSFWIMILLILATNFILTRTMIKNISV